MPLLIQSNPPLPGPTVLQAPPPNAVMGPSGWNAQNSSPFGFPFGPPALLWSSGPLVATTLTAFIRAGNDASRWWVNDCACGSIHQIYNRVPAFTCYNQNPFVTYGLSFVTTSDLPIADFSWVIAGGPSVYLAISPNCILSGSGSGWTRFAGILPAGIWQSICSNGSGTYVAAGYDIYGHGLICYSNSPTVSWTSVSLPYNTGALLYLYWDGAQFIAVGRNTVLYSANGTSWTAGTISAGVWNGISSNGANLYVATDKNGLVATSANGQTFTAGTAIGVPVNDVYYGSSVFCAVGPNACYTSPTGVTWTSQSIPAGTWNGLIFDGSTFIACGAGCIATSPTGVTWTARTSPSSTANYMDVQNVGTTNYSIVGYGPTGAYSSNLVGWGAATFPAIGAEILKAGKWISS